ncbi:MAG: transcriptional regulator [Pirellulales bacterium]
MSLELPKTEDADGLRRDLLELSKCLEIAPAELRCRATPILERIIQDTQRRRRLLVSIQDALSQLRLDMKYLVFDLEATRRERDTYRRQAGGGASPPDAPRGSDD